MHLTPRLVFFLVLPPLLWAGNAVVGRLAIERMDPLWLGTIGPWVHLNGSTGTVARTGPRGARSPPRRGRPPHDEP